MRKKIITEKLSKDYAEWEADLNFPIKNLTGGDLLNIIRQGIKWGMLDVMEEKERIKEGRPAR